MPSATERPLARADFESALLGAIGEFDFELSRFCRMVASGRCPRPLLQRYARETYRGALLFCANLADLAQQAPDGEARLVLLENLLEEEGIHLREGRGLISRPEQRHPALAMRFVKACGAEIADARQSEDELPHLSTPGRRLIDERRWLEAVSFLLIGQEYRFATISALLLDHFRGLGLAERDLAFFSVHIEADDTHGRQALDLVLDRAKTAGEQQACIAAARDGSRNWFEHHGAERALREAA